MGDTDGILRFAPAQQPAGHWLINGNFCVFVHDRPNRFHRWTARLLLGWEWKPATAPGGG